MHFGRPLIKGYTSADSRNKSPAYIVSKTDDIDPKVCGRVKIGQVGSHHFQLKGGSAFVKKYWKPFA